MNYKRNNVFEAIKGKIKESHLEYPGLVLKEMRKSYITKEFYGQTGEDKELIKYLPQRVGFYVDIGAGRPVTSSNTYIFHKMGWCGICVDPIETNYKLLRRFRKSSLIVKGLISEKRETIDFWEFEPYEYSTADEVTAERLLKEAKVKVKKKSKIETFPLSDLASLIPTNLPTLLSIDAEGFDLEILKSNNWTYFRPSVI